MIDEHRETFDENNIRDFVDLYLAKEKNDTQKQITGFDYMHIEWHLMTNTRTSHNASLTLARLLATNLSWQVVPFLGHELGGYRIVHD